jgi:hypothetical protein
MTCVFSLERNATLIPVHRMPDKITKKSDILNGAF